MVVKLILIGPSIQNLNKNYNYASVVLRIRLDAWIMNGILDNPSFSQIPRWYGIDDVEGSLNERARAYLAVNCSSCHRLQGSAANSGFYLEYENTDSLSLGFLENSSCSWCWFRRTYLCNTSRKGG